MTISRAAIKKILKSAGADRASDEAVVELTEVVNKFAYDLAHKAVTLAAHAKRKTIKRKDIELAR